MRRPRAGLVTSHSGGVGAPPGWPLRAACEELADDPERHRTKARPDVGRRTPQWSAGRRASLADICADCVNLSAAQGMRRRRSQAGADCASLSARGSWCAFRRSAPLTVGDERNEGEPGAFQTIRVAKLWLFDN